MKNKDRVKDHQKNESLEKILAELEGLLKPVNDKIVSANEGPDKPVVFIMGCARSGTTLLLQYLSQTNLFGYPNNIISRFYYAPYIGTRIYQMLYECDSKGEIFPWKDQNQLESELGKTKGPSQPHEFWYFWNRFFQFNSDNSLTDESKSSSNLKAFVKEIGAFQSATNKPLVMKALNLNWDIPLLQSASDNFYFIHLKRDTSYNAQSLLKARKSFFGDYSKWYSFKTPNYDQLKHAPSWEQVVEQVKSNNLAIEEGFAKIPSNKTIQISYEDFIKNPHKLLIRLKELNITSETPELNHSLQISDQITIEPEIWKSITEYVKKNP